MQEYADSVLIQLLNCMGTRFILFESLFVFMQEDNRGVISLNKCWTEEGYILIVVLL